ncbi:hypothetical protein C8A05DRAFT_37327 [Staphylotrichum tortipilum]|uniref:Uncharacterized protein n=1 Tax=Staphylotrichum tortipilum TaxID=2831512 RepID=A0AAN6RR30_9PEZI|nr:hypothetical protein C8A05DRAFT_37327 [Staphylotrichum longicolle]
MKPSLAFLLPAVGLASARAGTLTGRQVNSTGSEVSSIGVNSVQGADVGPISLAGLGLDNLAGLNVNGLNLGGVDLGNQNLVAEAILAMLGSVCLGNSLSLNNILSFGFNNDIDLFFQLAQLMQLQQLGFLDVGGIQSLFNTGLVLGGFNLGVFKREIASARKTMKRTKLRRGQPAKRQQCAPGTGVDAVGNAGGLSQVGGAVTAPAASAGGFTIATAPAESTFVTSTSAAAIAAPAATVATTSTVAAVATPATTSTSSTTNAVAAVATSPVAAAEPPLSLSVAASVISPIASSVTPAAAAAASTTAAAAAVESAAVAAPEAASTAVATDAVGGGVDNLSDLTR